MKLEIKIDHEVNRSIRVRQLEAMFDVPAQEKLALSWTGELPIESGDWNVGLIVGPSGSGKSVILKHIYGEQAPLDWSSKSVIDDFPSTTPMDTITGACMSVGFNTIPAWMRPYSVLSNGERFRVELARRLVSGDSPVVMDEFTSVVDRQIAQIGSYAVQKTIRRSGGKFVAASCHYDIIDWLQPDWILEPATMTFTKRRLLRPGGQPQPRPGLEARIERTPYGYWELFSAFHYMTADLNKAARCFTLFVNDRPASFGGVLYRPHAKVNNIMGLSRLVTLPDWQGLGLAMILSCKLGAAYASVGKRFHTYPVHPSLVRSYKGDSMNWLQQKEAGLYSPRRGESSTVAGFGGRPCAVFEYIGPVIPKEDAEKLLNG